MSTLPSGDDELVSFVRRALLPPAFPLRRDVAAAGAVADPFAGGAYDIFWPAADRLFVIAYGVDGGNGGLDDALALGGLRHLLRACARAETDAQAFARRAEGAFAALRPGRSLDLAVVALDAAARAATWATRGRAYAGPARGAEGEGDFWAAVGLGEAPSGSGEPDGDLGAAVGAVLAAQPAFRSAAAVRFLAAPTAFADVFLLPNDAAEIAPLLGDIERRLLRRGVPEDALARLALALDELCANVISYAYGDGQAHEIVVRLAVEPPRVSIRVEDDGIPFDPLGASPPDLTDDLDLRTVGGLGIHFVRTIMSEARYERLRGWNVLHLEMPFEGEPPVAATGPSGPFDATDQGEESCPPQRA